LQRTKAAMERSATGNENMWHAVYSGEDGGGRGKNEKNKKPDIS